MGKEFIDTGSAEDDAVADTTAPALAKVSSGERQKDTVLSPEVIKAIQQVVRDDQVARDNHGSEGSRVRRIIPHKKVLIRAGEVDRKTLWRWIRAGTFWSPVQLSENKIGFYDDKVSEWERSRPRVSYAPQAS